jgi:CRISPR-associated protein Cas1
MAWRGVQITRPARLSLEDGQLAVAQEDGEVRLALEDVAWLIIDTPQATLTAALLSACMEAGIAVMTTDARHMPSGLLLPFHRHHRQADIAFKQANTGAPLRKRLWQAIARAKIANQAAALDRLGRADAAAIRQMLAHVGSGDPDNVEARAARAYWASLWPDFVRDDEGDTRNMRLNYGYAVMRACVARALVGAGLLPAFGLHHASAVNPFNLADDLIEPFRPFVDELVWQMAGDGAPSRAKLTREDRQQLAGLPLAACRMGADRLTLLAASERAAASLVRAIEGASPELLELPIFAT